MDTPHPTLSIHPFSVRRAFGEDRDHPALVGTITGIVGDNLLVSLMGGHCVELSIDSAGFTEALDRHDLCRHDHALIVLVNSHYRLLGLAIGPPDPPLRLEVLYGACRLENGSAVEIVGNHPHPGWLLFRCTVTSNPHTLSSGNPGSVATSALRPSGIL